MLTSCQHIPTLASIHSHSPLYSNTTNCLDLVKRKLFYVKHKIISIFVSKSKNLIKNSYYNKIVRILLWVTNLSLVASIGTSLVIVIAFIFTLSDEGELMSAWEVEIGEQITHLKVMSKSPSIDDPKIVINKGVVQFTSRNIGYYMLKFMDAIIVILPAIYIIILLKRTLRSIHLEHPFTKENARRLKYIAFALMLVSPYSLIKSLVYRSYVINNIGVEGKTYADIFEIFHSFSAPPANKIWLALDINFQALLTGVILLVIAEVFRVGVLMKEDNDSIV